MSSIEPEHGSGGREVEVLVEGKWIAAVVSDHKDDQYTVWTLDEEPTREFTIRADSPSIRKSTRYS